MRIENGKELNKVSEVKCPHCKEWTLWRGHVDDRCLYCGSFLDPQRFSRDVERKIRNEVIAEQDLFYIKPEDGPTKRRIKEQLNKLRWLFFYVQLGFAIFVGFILLIISILPG
ncbi:hypothetical protein GCM10027037_15440 [Mucilaginibacter koreensis]